jgi:SAM-dependent methyltransferase
MQAHQVSAPAQRPSTRVAHSPCPVCTSTSATRVFPSDPLPDLDAIKSFYPDDYHSELLSAEATIAAFGPKFNAYVDWVCRYIRSGRSLDLGCSTGLFPYLLQQRGFQAEGLELHPATARFGREAFSIMIRNEPFETADYTPESFDLISLTDVLEHSLNPLVTLRRVYQMLRPNGFVLVTFPDIESPESTYFRALARLAHRDWLWENCHVPHHTWEFTRPTAEALFHRAGFHLVDFRRSHVDLPDKRRPVHTILRLPVKLLRVPALGRAFGTQMEFLIQKHAV